MFKFFEPSLSFAQSSRGFQARLFTAGKQATQQKQQMASRFWSILSV